mmetsp:Transcript_79799/g.129355  ORF Transcript_79799/g.129355 Transcript_79799/m.129355 type:complete len:200 (-) Transcript_79799:435-1034(-)
MSKRLGEGGSLQPQVDILSCSIVSGEILCGADSTASAIFFKTSSAKQILSRKIPWSWKKFSIARMQSGGRTAACSSAGSRTIPAGTLVIWGQPSNENVASCLVDCVNHPDNKDSAVLATDMGSDCGRMTMFFSSQSRASFHGTRYSVLLSGSTWCSEMVLMLPGLPQSSCMCVLSRCMCVLWPSMRLRKRTRARETLSP